MYLPVAQANSCPFWVWWAFLSALGRITGWLAMFRWWSTGYGGQWLAKCACLRFVFLLLGVLAHQKLSMAETNTVMKTIKGTSMISFCKTPSITCRPWWIHMLPLKRFYGCICRENTPNIDSFGISDSIGYIPCCYLLSAFHRSENT